MKIINYSPAISSLNLGDHIISESANKYLRQLFPTSFFVDITTHMAVSAHYLSLINPNYSFVLGSNLLQSDIKSNPTKSWDIDIKTARMMTPVILIGCGWWQYQGKPENYTKRVYDTVLHKTFFHSVRDEYTKNMLADIGISNTLNTGCPTTWGFSESFCSSIPKNKSVDVVTTLTDYNFSIEKDRILLETLKANYRTVYLWPQGSNDIMFFERLGIDGITLLPSSLIAYDNLLSENNELEYVGTRLHGGIRALQHKRRTLIVAVDNRGAEKKRDFNLPVIMREDVESLETYIHESRATEIHINQQAIDSFLGQF